MYELIEHTADVRAAVTAPTLEELFADSLRSLMAAMSAEPHGEEVRRRVEIDSADRTTLLVDFLSEALSLSLIYGEAYDGVQFESLSEASLSGELIGRAAGFAEEIKAVTYHEANVEQAADGSWSTTLVFDI